MAYSIPKEVKEIGGILAKAGHKAYLVGGCVRDLILSGAEGILRTPKDWDIATDATPTEIQKLFFNFGGRTKEDPATVYENDFGTVLVKLAPRINADIDADQDIKQLGKDISENQRIVQLSSAFPRIVEVTTFRKEGKYTDKRHPDNVTFSKTIEDDLSRRDFTVNAMGMELGITNKESGVIDPYGGEADLKNKLIRAVGDPDERFNEDALRLMRAVRFAAELGFEIEEKTAEVVARHAGLLEMIAKERIRDEFTKILMSDRPMEGVETLERFGLLKHIMPELREGIGVGQNLHHIYTVWEHNLRALKYTADKKYPFLIRMAALLHDVGKPRSKQGDGKYSTFYGHDVIGARMTPAILDRLHYEKSFIEDVAHLVRHHLFYYNVDEVTAAGVRRFLARVGPENIDDLIKIREADRIGSGVPKAVPYKLRHLLFMIEKVKRDPISPKMLTLRGEDIMAIAGIPPSPKVGQILAALLEEVLDDPEKNKKEYLEARVKELATLSEAELKRLAEKSKEKKDEFEAGIEEDMKKQFYVK